MEELKIKVGRVVRKVADEIGGGEVISTVSDDYAGHCKVILEFNFKQYSAVFINYTEALKLSTYAINPLVGGYQSASVSETLEPVDQQDAELYFFAL